MRKTYLLLLFVLIAAGVFVLPDSVVQNAVRGVRPYQAQQLLASTRFDAAQSAGLFVGIPRFTDDTLTDVLYAADDAVDLAYTFAMASGERLLLPSRCVIAISDDPVKQISKERLKALRSAGAIVTRDTDQDSLLDLVKKQSALAGIDGMVIVSFATHGFNTEGIPYLLASSSSFTRRKTTLSAANIADIVAGSAARRSLLFFDACRQYVRSDLRGLIGRPSALLRKLANVEGQVIFYASAPGGYAHDDRKRRNGVFTAAVIDALQCRGGESAMITVDKLATRVENQVLDFLQQRDSGIRKATQMSVEGLTKSMPLVQCRPTSIGSPTYVTTTRVNGSSVEAIDGNGHSMWSRDLGGPIRKTFVEQLFREDTRQVIVLSDDESESSSVVTIFDNAGNLHSRYPYEGRLQYLEIAKPTWRHNPRIVAAGVRNRGPARLGIRGALPTVMLLEPKLAGALECVWAGVMLDTHERVNALSIEGTQRSREIVFSTSDGSTLRLDFNGNTLDREDSGEQTPFSLIPPESR